MNSTFEYHQREFKIKIKIIRSIANVSLVVVIGQNLFPCILQFFCVLFHAVVSLHQNKYSLSFLIHSGVINIFHALSTCAFLTHTHTHKSKKQHEAKKKNEKMMSVRSQLERSSDKKNIRKITQKLERESETK